MAQRTGLTVLLVTAVALTAIDQARKTWVQTSGCQLWRKRPWTGLGKSFRSPQNRPPGTEPVSGDHTARGLAGCQASRRLGFGGGPPQAGRSHRKAPTRRGQADVDCRYPIPRADRLAADKPEYETVGGGAGEGAIASGTPCAISLAVPLYRDRADARSRCRALLYPAPPDQSPRVA